LKLYVVFGASLFIHSDLTYYCLYVRLTIYSLLITALHYIMHYTVHCPDISVKVVQVIQSLDIYYLLHFIWCRNNLLLSVGQSYKFKRESFTIVTWKYD